MQNQSSPQHGLRQILFGIILPVFILNKGGRYMDPAFALGLALIFPLGLGAYEFFKHRKMSFISLLGLINVSVTGTLALLKLGGLWFAVKEAAFPLLIGGFVFGSGYTATPFFKTLLLNPNLMNLELIDSALDKNQNRGHFELLVRRSNSVVALSFLMSAALNFIIAIQVFIPLDPNLSGEAKTQLLNEQLAQMTYKAMLITAVPSFIVMISVFYFFLSRLTKLTLLSQEELLKAEAPAASPN